MSTAWGTVPALALGGRGLGFLGALGPPRVHAAPGLFPRSRSHAGCSPLLDRPLDLSTHCPGPSGPLSQPSSSAAWPAPWSRGPEAPAALGSTAPSRARPAEGGCRWRPLPLLLPLSLPGGPGVPQESAEPPLPSSKSLQMAAGASAVGPEPSSSEPSYRAPAGPQHLPPPVIPPGRPSLPESRLSVPRGLLQVRFLPPPVESPARPRRLPALTCPRRPGSRGPAPRGSQSPASGRRPAPGPRSPAVDPHR